MRLRRARHPEDLEALEALFETCRLADGHAPLGEHKYLDLVSGGGDSTLGIIGEEEGWPVAYAHLTRNERSGVWGLELALHPLHRHPPLIRRMVREANEAAAGLGGGEIHLWVYHPKLAQTLRELGFEERRELRQLRRSLPPPAAAEFPPGVEVRPFRVGDDEVAWLEVNNAAFAGHPENGSWDLETLRERERQPWFDPEGFRLAWEGEELVGFCWTKLHEREAMGEIYVIAVAPRHQGRKLGRALALDGLWDLYERQGAETAMLYVDAANHRALGLYEDLGFHLDHVDRCFATRAQPGVAAPAAGSPPP